MLHFFKSFLNRSLTPSTAAISADETPVATVNPLNPVPMETLFAEHQPPMSEKDATIEVKPIRDFLSENFTFQGRKAGYEHHNLEYLQMHIQQLRARFRSACDQHLQLMENDLIQAKTIFIQIGDALPSEQAIMQMRIDKIISNMEEIRLQKVLSVESEGLISEPVHTFITGFHQGLSDYVDEVKFGSHDLL
jgi:hypothetical protein